MGAERLAFCYQSSEIALLTYFFVLFLFIFFPNEVHIFLMKKKKILALKCFHLLE